MAGQYETASYHAQPMNSRAGRALVIGAVAAVALVAAWFVPPLAIVVVWPIFVFLPGWSATRLLGLRVDTAGRLALAVVGSVAVSTHLVHAISWLAGGYGRATIFLSAALLAAAVAWMEAGGLGRPVPRIGRGLRSALPVAIAGMAVVGLTLGVGLWRMTETGVSSGGSNWSDLGVHLSIAETLNAGANFPPEVPYFAGVPLVYHWFADFHAAILAQSAGLFSIPAMIVQSTVLTGALALGVFSLARRLARGAGARRIGALAAALVVFGGGMGYVLLIRDVATGMGSPLDLIAQNSYDNQWLTDWPYFRIPSVMGTGLLAHRATTAGLPILVGAVLLLVTALPTARQRASGWRDRRWALAAAGLLGALLAPFHFFYFPVFPLLALAWVVAGRRFDADAPRNAAALLLPYVLALPFVVAPALAAGGSGAARFVGIWPSAPVADGPAAVIFFYLTNLGVPFALAIAALFQRGVPKPAFLGAWLIGLFLIPNLVQLSVIDFDMNKYFQAMWIAVAILAAWLIHRWPVAAIAVVLLLSIPSPLLVAGWTATSRLQVLSHGEIAAAEWVRHETPPGAVFVTDGWVNSLTDSAGRKRLTTFGPYVANLGYRPDQRIADVVEIYCGGDANRSAELMRHHGATYLVEGRPQPCNIPVDFATSSAFELAWDGSPRIWRLADAP
jgi:hypothetical protein